jgi:hypothetical protein
MGLQIYFLNHTYNEGQIGWFVAGSALNLSSRKRINKPAILYSKRLRKLGRFFI